MSALFSMPGYIIIMVAKIMLWNQCQFLCLCQLAPGNVFNPDQVEWLLYSEGYGESVTQTFSTQSKHPNVNQYNWEDYYSWLNNYGFIFIMQDTPTHVCLI